MEIKKLLKVGNMFENPSSIYFRTILWHNPWCVLLMKEWFSNNLSVNIFRASAVLLGSSELAVTKMLGKRLEKCWENGGKILDFCPKKVEKNCVGTFI